MQMQLTNLHNRGMMPSVLVKEVKKAVHSPNFCQLFSAYQMACSFLDDTVKTFHVVFYVAQASAWLLFYTNTDIQYRGVFMLLLAHSLRDFSFSKLMEVYIEGNLENAEEFYPDLPDGQKLMQAEQDFYQYLHEVFFCMPSAVYAVWEEQGRYLSALRLEPYRDGLLLEALETEPSSRRQGYAEQLICAVQNHFRDQKMYSHVGKKNLPSLRVHEKCGFRRISEHAVYIDGSVNQRTCTLCWENGLALQPIFC